MKKKFIYICTILSLILLTIISIILWQFSDPDRNKVGVNLIYNSFISTSLTDDDATKLTSLLDNGSVHNDFFNPYDNSLITGIQFVKKHNYKDTLYFKDIISYENKFYDVPKECYSIISKYLNGEFFIKEAINKGEIIKVSANDLAQRSLTLNPYHINELREIVGSLSLSAASSSTAIPAENLPKYTIDVYDKSGAKVSLYVIDQTTIYVKDALENNTVRVNSSELWDFLNKIIPSDYFKYIH